MTSPILITGGTGTLGRLVVPRLAADHPVRVLSRGRRPGAPGVEHVTADLLSGKGIAAALADVRVIVHLAGGPRGDDRAAHTLLKAAGNSGVEHVLAISVVGADRMPVGYFRAKLGLEQALAAGGVPWSLVRAAQFQESCYDLAVRMARLPVVPIPTGIRLQPVAAAEVADRLAELAVGHSAGRVDDIVGPTTYDAAHVIRSALRACGKHRLCLPVRIPGKAGRAYRAGWNLSNSSVRGQTWEAVLGQVGAGPAVAAGTRR
ncbi:MAG TPA: NAD(P)H-binding protein [Aldersonia sp.]